MSQLKLCSEYPSLVDVPVVPQSFIPSRPLGTWFVIDESLIPPWPGWRKTDMPAMPEARAVGVSSSIANDRTIIDTTMAAAFPRQLPAVMDIAAGKSMSAAREF